MLTSLSSEQIFTIAQGVLTFLLSIGIGLSCWFVNKLFAEIEKGRQNDRELYKMVAQTREDMLKLEVERLRTENSRLQK